MKIKHIFRVSCITCILFLMTACSSVTVEDVMRNVESTDLSSENIDEMKAGMLIGDQSFSREHGTLEPDPANEHYSNQRNYDQYWNKDVLVSVDRETREILQIGVLEDNNTSSSERGIRIGASVGDVITNYGENYYTYEDKEQDINLIGYVDHLHNIEISFVHLNDEVIGISTGYAFDRMNWQ